MNATRQTNRRCRRAGGGRRLAPTVVVAATLGLALVAAACSAFSSGTVSPASPSPSPTRSAAEVTISPASGLLQARPEHGITVTVRDGTLVSVTGSTGGDAVAGKLDATATDLAQPLGAHH